MASFPVDQGLRDASLHGLHTILQFHGNGIARYRNVHERRGMLSVVASTNAQGGSRGGMRPAQPKGDLRVPSSKELQKMRQFRQQQLFKQQQQMRNVQRLAPAPGLVPGGGAPNKGEQARSTTGVKKPSTVGTSSSKRTNSISRHQQEKRKKDSFVDDGMTDAEFMAFASLYGLEHEWRPQIAILTKLGLSPTQLKRIAESRREIFQTSSKTMNRKIAFFKDSVGMVDADIVKIVCKSPRVLEYGSEQTVRPRIEFLKECGVPCQNTSKVVLKAPMIMSLGLKETLQPRVEFLRNALSLNKSNLGKLISRHPQVLTCTEDMMQQRVDFLMSRAGVTAKDLGKVVVAHPQVLHYKLDSMLERLDYLSSVGMNQEQIAHAVSRFPQIFSLSVTTNMAPKWHYLVEHLGGDVHALCSYPGYFSLSLNNRIVMRHHFLQYIHGKAPLPFPLGHLKMSDEKFATEIAGSSLTEYEAFKMQRASNDASKSDSEGEVYMIDGINDGNGAMPNVSTGTQSNHKLSNVLRKNVIITKPPSTNLNLV